MFCFAGKAPYLKAKWVLVPVSVDERILSEETKMRLWVEAARRFLVSKAPLVFCGRSWRNSNSKSPQTHPRCPQVGKADVPSAEPGPQGENSGGRPRSAGLRGREGVALLECVIYLVEIGNQITTV